jgi:hypothetical protein
VLRNVYKHRMIRAIAQNWTVPGRRRVGALLLALCLNLAIIPCAMALEVVEQGHDCCPPEIQLEAVECCELDAVSIDARSGTLGPFDPPDSDAMPASWPFQDLSTAPAHHWSSVGPPDPPDDFPPLHELFCVYLK